MASNAVLSRVERVSLPARSMFQATPIYRLNDGALVFGLRQPLLLPAAGDVNIKIPEQSSQRLDLIAQQFYGQASAWAAIADVAGIIDPLAEINTADTIRAPSAARLPS